ncbi:MAG: hypothetical protein WCK82_12170 [Bacteroidota bacterium]
MNAKLWTKESVLADAKKFSSVGEWRKHSPSAYVICCRNKWNEEACIHMSKKKQVNGYWTEEKILKEANKFSSTAEWAAASPSSYAVAKRKKIVPQTMERGLVHNQWSKTKIAGVAKHCKTRGEFRSTYPSAYSIAIEKGWLEDVCAHMLTKAPWFGPRVIREFLLSHDIEFIAEYKFKNEATVKKFPYDFYLPEFKLLIEYQGRQHKVGWFNDSADAAAIQARDKVKRTFAQNSGLYYLELDQTTKKSLIKELDSYLKHIAKELKIVISSHPRQLSDSELKYVETAFKWSNASVIEAIGNCKSVKEFREKYPSGYDYALKNDLWEGLSKSLTRITQHGKYTKNYVSGIAMACKTRNEFKITNKGAWAAAQRNGWLDEVCAHMPKHVQRSTD